ncbi:hypothetical protein [Actinoplanes sp. N902-109]|uniref:hypothetical protein n=1 Tax=Actinoplanes sp. (strain N902-109) TaxID=649831 RepID=UPI0003293E06|nr:hypothetical protein [Actinoplanes sp. N902-109]AGL19532.1 hypothetical protein L083_6022 [Actinoplanes sp. N902-109]
MTHPPAGPSNPTGPSGPGRDPEAPLDPHSPEGRATAARLGRTLALIELEIAERHAGQIARAA